MIFKLKIGIAALLFLLLGSFTFFKNTELPFPVKESSLLWKIEHPETHKISYVFGTMHLIEKQYFIFPQKLTKTLQKSDLLIMELAGLPNQSEAMKLLLLKEGSFFDFFNEKQLDSIYTWAKNEMGLTKEAFQASFRQMKPFVALQMATQMHFMGKTESYEMKFEELARTSKIPIEGLETLEEQMQIFDNLSKEEQSQLVMEGIRNPKDSYLQMQEIQKLYARQNIDSLYMLVNKDQESIISKKEVDFLDNRNKKWIPQINNITKNKRAFIAVGGAHLGGPNGILRLLEKEGFIVEPVKI